MTRFLLLYLTLLLTFSVLSAQAEEPQWGELSGQLIYDGEPPERKKLEVKAGYPETLDESLVVDPETHGLANVFVYLRTPKNETTPLQVHPDYAEHIKQPVHWTIDDRGYSPHVLLIHTVQPIEFHARGREALACKSELFYNPGSSLLLPPKRDFESTFSKPESLPATFGCAIHGWFRGYALIRDNPYMAVTDTEGRFTIKNLPAGEHEFQFWQEETGYAELPVVKLRDAEVPSTPAKGRIVVEIEAGENHLGIIKFDPKQFE